MSSPKRAHEPTRSGGHRHRSGALEIATDDPRRDDVLELLEAHTRFAHADTPLEDAHALDSAGLSDASVTFFSARRDGGLVAVGAIREIDPHHAELKSMHTSASARRQGVGEAMLRHLISVARGRSYRRLSLETGAHPTFAPARALYAKAGFRDTAPFGAYRESAHSVYMTLDLTA